MKVDFTPRLKLVSSQIDAPGTSILTRQNVNLSLSFYTDVMNRGLQQENSCNVSRVALRHLAMEIAEISLARICPGDFIEIYSKDCIQLFRTLNLQKLMSYSVETLLSGSFEDLFERDERYKGLIIQAASKIITGQQTYLEDFCPAHEVREKYGEKCSQNGL